MYLLNGEKKALESVIKEQRIRIGRGLISITPVSEAGLVSEEDVEKALESKQKVIDELSVENESQKKEIDELKAKLAELDSHVDDAKDVQEDNKMLSRPTQRRFLPRMIRQPLFRTRKKFLLRNRRNKELPC